MNNFDQKKERKKNTSKRQGNRGENNLVDVFATRFQDHKFFRAIGSGNRGSQVDLSEEAKCVFTGDLAVEKNFKFVIEAKYGYTDIEICGIFSQGHKEIDGWLKKVRRDADSLNKFPIVCWRKPYYKWLGFIPYELFFNTVKQPINFMKYYGEEEWAIVSLDKLLSLPDEFWFKAS